MRKRSWPISRYYLGICLERLGESYEETDWGCPISLPRFEATNTKQACLPVAATFGLFRKRICAVKLHVPYMSYKVPGIFSSVLKASPLMNKEFPAGSTTPFAWQRWPVPVPFTQLDYRSHGCGSHTVYLYTSSLPNEQTERCVGGMRFCRKAVSGSIRRPA